MGLTASVPVYIVDPPRKLVALGIANAFRSSVNSDHHVVPGVDVGSCTFDVQSSSKV